MIKRLWRKLFPVKHYHTITIIEGNNVKIWVNGVVQNYDPSTFTVSLHSNILADIEGYTNWCDSVDNPHPATDRSI